MAQTGAASFEPLTGIGGVLGAATFVAASASGVSSSDGSTASSGAASFSRPTASASASAGSAAEGDAAFEQAAAAAYGPMSTSISFEDMLATGTSLTGGVARAAPLFEPMASSAASRGGSVAIGSPTHQALTALAVSATPRVGTGAASFERPRGSALSLVGSVSTGSAAHRALAALAQAQASAPGVASAQSLPMSAAGISSATLADAARTWAVNLGSGATTEYQNYDFDGYANFAGHQYGAGPSGILRLDGADDAGADIAWAVRTGMVDDKSGQLKRLEELLMSARADGPVRVRVWTDENRYFDYNIPNFRPDVIQQVRAKLGKGARSRYYRVEVFGIGNVAAEITSLQLPLVQLNRRVG